MATRKLIQAAVPASSKADAVASLARLEKRCRRHAPQFEGRRVVWRCLGDGPSLVLLHGGHGNWLHWARNIEALAERYSVWIPDLPGYGDSDAAASTDLSSVVEPTIATLDSLLGTERVIDLAGFSFGGLIAAHIAARRKRIRKLVLLGPAGHGGPRRSRGELLPWRGVAGEQDKTALSAVMRHNLAMHMLHDQGRIDELAIEIHAKACIQTRFRSKDLSRGGGLRTALPQVEANALIIFGEHDVTADPEATIRILAGTRAECQTHVAADAGHWVQYERADEINRLLTDWLG